ncbi:MAG: MaoC family dehydratase N-terminal domain-containing protein [Deltaproteobacteria bacterium]|jgi:hydroxyacyl-ACP dehydratase HTD2-like protein with hotdog domain|nr:MaoC family dehydratase N-terminal domain-containing protein [Deltaproteobacteria bacterium]
MDVKELKDRFTGFVFDEIDMDVEAESLRDFALACGETLARFTDPADPDFQSVPNYTTRIHGTRSMPEDFPIDPHRCFDAGKSVEVHAPVRPGDKVVGRSEIADIYEKTGRTGAMLFIVHRMNFYNQRGDHLATVDWRLVQREMD